LSDNAITNDLRASERVKHHMVARVPSFQKDPAPARKGALLHRLHGVTKTVGMEAKREAMIVADGEVLPRDACCTAASAAAEELATCYQNNVSCS
jgi:hypothetical protein